MMERVLARLQMNPIYRSLLVGEKDFTRNLANDREKDASEKNSDKEFSDEADSSSVEMSSFLKGNGYEELSKLFAHYTTKSSKEHRESSSSYHNPHSLSIEPLSVEALEMLEAELINQGILSISADSLSKRARREISLLLWNAKRQNATSDTITFKIDLKAFILFEVLKLCTNDNVNYSSLHSIKQKLKNELSYLEQFASYLNGAYEIPKSGYEKGLNLVLRAILKVDHQVKEETSQASLCCTLPSSKHDFMLLLSRNTGINESSEETVKDSTEGDILEKSPY